MDKCPKCNIGLEKLKSELGKYLACSKCLGKAINLSILRKSNLDRKYIDYLFHQSQADINRKGRICPKCGKNMSLQTINAFDGEKSYEICPECNLFWFDYGEYEAFPKHMDEYVPKGYHSADQAILEYERQIETQINEIERLTDLKPHSFWQLIASFFALPIEEDDSIFDHYPFITWLLAFTSVFLFFFTSNDLVSTIANLGFIPAEWNRYFGLTIITSMVLHVSIWHMFFNVYFLLVFGDNVEEELGRLWFMFLIIVSHCMGLFFHTIFCSDKTIPLIGASNAVSGILTFYTLLFPKKIIGLGIRFYVKFGVIRMRVWVFFAFWIIFQFINLFMQIEADGSVSALGHFGGVFTGVIAMIIYKMINKIKTAE